MAGSDWDSKPRRELKVLVLSLPRTGTASMAEALTMLGYEGVPHASLMPFWTKGWSVVGRAADASFPSLPSYTGRPLTRAQWDELLGRSEAATDMAGLFATQLIPLYPEAKVIVAMRDFDKWKGSIEFLLGVLWSPTANAIGRWVDPVFGSGAVAALRKAVMGLFGTATDTDAALRNARAVYDEHHRRIRELVAPGQLLEYRIGQGWRPLCDFLDRPVPRADFPWLNDSEKLAESARGFLWQLVAAAAWRLVPLLVAAAALGAYWVGRPG